MSWTRAGTWVIALVVGAVYATAGTVAHAYTVGPVPVGLILALIGIAALLAAVRLLTGDRWAALATGIGAVVATVVFSGAGPGGSVIVPNDGLGLAWTIAVPVVAAAIVTWPSRAPRAPGGPFSSTN